MNNYAEDARYLYDQIFKFRILNEQSVKTMVVSWVHLCVTLTGGARLNTEAELR